MKAKREIDTWTLQESKKKTMEHKSDCNTNCNQRITRTSGRENKTSGDHPNDKIVEIGQNTKKSPGDLKRFAITKTLVKNHQQTQAWKTLKGVK